MQARRSATGFHRPRAARGARGAESGVAVDTLFYDGRCPLCMREVALLRRLARSTLAFEDIHGARDATLPSREALLQSLHLRRAGGEMVVGLAANVAMWQHTRFGLLWRVLLLPGIRALTVPLYNYWARRRYSRLYGCVLREDAP